MTTPPQVLVENGAVFATISRKDVSLLPKGEQLTCVNYWVINVRNYIMVFGVLFD